MELEFGVGERPIDQRVVDGVDVIWPRRQFRQTFTNVAVGQLLVVTETSDDLLVTRVIPGSGSTAGDDDVTLLGFNFAAGASVFFDGAPATNVMFSMADNTITCTTPANAAGPADVRVDVGADTSTLVDGYTYINPGTDITITLNKDVSQNAVVVTWNDVGQARYQFHRALGPTPADFTAGSAFDTVVAGVQYVDSGILDDGVDYFYLVPGGECGNAMLDPAEDCEGLELGGETCQTLGFSAGALACSSICTFDVTACSN